MNSNAERKAANHSLRDGIIGAIIGAIATPAVGAILFLSGVLKDSIMNGITDAVLARLTLVSSHGTNKNGSDFTATCDEGTKIVGGSCTITRGDGYLQNAGSMPSNGGGSYFCTYSRRSDPNGVQADVTALCLKRKPSS